MKIKNLINFEFLNFFFFEKKIVYLNIFEKNI